MPDSRASEFDELQIRKQLELGLETLFGAGQVDPRQVNQLTRLVVLLAQWAPRMNLTGHRDPSEITSRLVLDAAALVATLPELDIASDLADLGSGAGFPGLPIAILRPHLRVFLVESRQKRHHFQREARRQLDLQQVTPVLGRSDKVEIHPCDIVVAQAMAQPEQALAKMRAWARAGGALVLPAAQDAEPPSPLQPGAPVERRSYSVPLSNVSRQLWIARVRGDEQSR